MPIQVPSESLTPAQAVLITRPLLALGLNSAHFPSESAINFQTLSRDSGSGYNSATRSRAGSSRSFKDQPSACSQARLIILIRPSCPTKLIMMGIWSKIVCRISFLFSRLPRPRAWPPFPSPGLSLATTKSLTVSSNRCRLSILFDPSAGLMLLEAGACSPTQRCGDNRSRATTLLALFLCQWVVDRRAHQRRPSLLVSAGVGGATQLQECAPRKRPIPEDRVYHVPADQRASQQGLATSLEPSNCNDFAANAQQPFVRKGNPGKGPRRNWVLDDKDFREPKSQKDSIPRTARSQPIIYDPNQGRRHRSTEDFRNARYR